MTREQILAWLKAHGGQADYKVKTESIDNPNRTSRTDPEKVERKIVTWTANDGTELTVIDNGAANEVVSDDSTPEMIDVTPQYQVVGEGKAPPKEPIDNRTPEAKANEQELDRQRRQNQAVTGKWETDDQRMDRERQQEADRQKDEDRRRAITAQDRANEIAQQNVDISRSNSERGWATESRAAAAQEAGNALNRDRFQYEREKDERESRTPKFLGQATDTNENIAYFDPVSGEVKGAPNPMYDRAKVEAARLREQLSLQIQLGRLRADEATQQYNRWFKENVEVPFMQAAERRAQAQERRAALQAEEQRRQFAAQEARQRRAMGLQAGQAAVQAELQTLPYRVGPAFGEQFSSAITSLGQGGSLDRNASAGINFTKDAFEFDRPNFKKISNEAMKDALKGLTSYSPAEGEFDVADYGGISFPSMGGAAPPAAAPSMDYDAIMKSIPYQPQQ